MLDICPQVRHKWLKVYGLLIYGNNNMEDITVII